MSKNNTKEVGSNRRTFLKTVGITMGVASYGSSGSVVRRPRGRGPPMSGAVHGRGPDERERPRIAVRRRSRPSTGGWTWRVPCTTPSPSSPTNVLYLAVTTNNTPPGERAGYLGAYDIETGDRRWKRTDFPSPKTPTTDGDTPYFPTQTAETEDHPTTVSTRSMRIPARRCGRAVTTVAVVPSDSRRRPGVHRER